MILLVLPADEQDQALFINAYNRYSRQVFKYAISILKSESKAEDAVQEAFMRFHKSLNRLRSREPRAIKSFLLTTTKRICIDMLKHPIELDFDTALEDVTFGDDLIDVIDTKQMLLDILRTLNEDDQRLLILRCLYDMTFGDIATIMGISEKYAAVKFGRLKTRLGTLYMEQMNEQKHAIS